MLDKNEIDQMLVAAAHIRAVNAVEDVENIPLPSHDNRWIRRVVCAAIRYDDGTIIVGPRHFDVTMHDQILARGLRETDMDLVQGFIDQHGVFMNRKEAYTVAVNANQLIRTVFQPDTLFSENLY